MKKLVIMAFVALSWASLGCATSYLKKPEVYSVKKMAIVSLYANTYIHDVSVQNPSESNIAKIKGLVDKDNKLEGDELTELVTHALRVYAEELNSIPNWSVASPKEVLSNPKYKAVLSKSKDDSDMGKFFSSINKVSRARWISPENMMHIPAEMLTHGKGKTVKTSGKKDPIEYAKEKMAELSKELGVDGVVVIGLDLAYKKSSPSKIKALDIIKTVKDTAEPNVAFEVIMVTKDAVLAIESPLLSKRGSGYYSTSKPLTMRLGFPYLKDDKSVDAYKRAIEKSAEGLRKKITKELSEE